MLAGNDARADGDFVAISLDVMNAAKCVIVSAAGAGRAEMVAKALSGEWSSYTSLSGLPLYGAFGFEEVGVFFDWSSLYQHKQHK